MRNKTHNILNFTEATNSQAKIEPCMKYVWRSQFTEWIDSLSRLGDANLSLFQTSVHISSGLYRTRTFSSFRGLVSPNGKLVNSNNGSAN